MNSRKSSRWTVEEANAWYEQQPLLCGCNYVPSTAVNSTEMWQAETFDPETIDRELGWAATIGFNTCRIFVQHLVWEQDSSGLKDRIDRFLSIAAGHGISTMPTLFDECDHSGKDPYLGKQDAPVPGIHNSGWTPSPSHRRAMDPAERPGLERYVKDIIGTFADDERVVVWDLLNEPGNPYASRDSTVLLVKAAFSWARKANPSQPLTVCVENNPSHFCWHTGVEQSDVISFHSYGDLNEVKKIIELLSDQNRPILCTEWMARSRESLFATHLPLFREKKIGSYCWGLVAGKTQTYHGAPEPELWYHDIFYADGRPYNSDEIEIIRQHCE